MNDRIAVTQEMWDRAQSALLAALTVIEELVPPQSIHGNMISLRDQICDAIYAPHSSPETKSAPHCCHEWVLMKGSMSSAGYRYVDRCKLCGEKRERTAPLEPGDSTFLEQFLNRGPSL